MLLRLIRSIAHAQKGKRQSLRLEHGTLLCVVPPHFSRIQMLGCFTCVQHNEGSNELLLSAIVVHASALGPDPMHACVEVTTIAATMHRNKLAALFFLFIPRTLHHALLMSAKRDIQCSFVSVSKLPPVNCLHPCHVPAHRFC